MKRKVIVLIGLLALLVQGCVVKSLHPFFHPRDVIFRQELINEWIDSEGSKWSIRKMEKTENTYEMHWLHKGERDITFVAHLFQLEGETYLDFVPHGEVKEETDFAMLSLHLLPVHSVAKVHVLNGDEVAIKWFNEEWMQSLFKQNRIKIAHEVVSTDPHNPKEDPYYVLTASTDELQKFLVKYGSEDSAYDDDNTVWLRLKRSTQ